MIKYIFKKKMYIFLAGLIDIIGYAVFFFARVFKKPIPNSPRNILLVRLDHMGDFVCTTPLFKNIRKKFPEAKITVLINSVSKDLAYRDPAIDKVITFSPAHLARNDKSPIFEGLKRVIKDVRAFNFDLGIDPRGDLLSVLIMWLGGVKYRVGYGITGGGFLLHKKGRYDKGMHVIDRNLVLLKDLNIPIEDRSPAVYFDEKDMEAVEGLLLEKGVGPNQHEIDALGQTPFSRAVVIHPFAGAPAREWTKDNFQNLIDILKNYNISTFLIGSSADKGSYANVVDMRGKFSLPQLACFIKRVGCFIGLNSGPANISAALGVPSVVISSGTNIIEDWIPPNKNVRFVYKDIACRPCELKVCGRKKHECMDRITAEEVLDKFKEIASPPFLLSQESMGGSQ